MDFPPLSEKKAEPLREMRDNVNVECFQYYAHMMGMRNSISFTLLQVSNNSDITTKKDLLNT